MKPCHDCGENKRNDAFPQNENTCYTCKKAARAVVNKTYRDNNKEKIKHYHHTRYREKMKSNKEEYKNKQIKLLPEKLIRIFINRGNFKMSDIQSRLKFHSKILINAIEKINSNIKKYNCHVYIGEDKINTIYIFSPIEFNYKYLNNTRICYEGDIS